MISEEQFEKEEAKREAQYDSITGYLEKNARIKKEIGRLKRLFKNIDENKKKLVFSTIDDVAFMTITMQDLRETIIREGTTVEYKNGKDQYGVKQSPDAQYYLQLSQKLTQAMKILVSCMPVEQKVRTTDLVDDGFDDFAEGRPDI